MRRFWFGTNFKMHHTPGESRQFMHELGARAADLIDAGDLHLFVIPPFTSIMDMADAASGSSVLVGAQNMHWADDGAYTGEIGARMLVAAGARLVMLGHAERRQQWGETDRDLNRKLHTALHHGLRVLLCVGETADEKQYGVGREVVARQLKIALHAIDQPDALLIAYEPVWSIGEGGTAADPAYVATMLIDMRGVLRELYGDRSADLPIVYGGSVNLNNCGLYARLPGVDGLFVGRAAWQADGFVGVLRTALRAREEI